MMGNAGSDADVRWMRAALSLGRTRLGSTGSNPSVGCVIVSNDGRLLGRAATAPSGRPHAETAALAEAHALWGDAAADLLAGATAYVTLEPCAHHGLTPPCAEALIRSGVRRAVIALLDPDPRVSGRGIEILRAAGVETTIGLLAEEAEETLGGYLLNRREGRPRLTLKLAASIDGRIATATGESQWISGPEARERAHHIRAASNVVLVGSGTALADDPRLDVRIRALEDQSPARAVADALLRTPLDGQLMRSAKKRRLFLLHAEDAPDERREAAIEAGAELIEAPRDASGVLDPLAMLKSLGARGALEVMCEGGGRLAASLLRSDLVDRLVWAQAGVAIGAEGAPAIGGLGLDILAAAPRLELVRSERIGADMVTEWRRRRETSEETAS